METDPTLFQSKTFLFEENSDMKQWVHERFQKRATDCKWNNAEVSYAQHPI